jgi:SagB-type dehydrogenase family enzyme
VERSAIEAVYAYHRDSKHHLDRYAPGPGGLDWANQPNPFRVFEGAPTVDLPFTADRLREAYARIRAGARPDPAPLGRDAVAALLALALGLSAWKSHGGSRWALRCNPSSGNLHPTECYLLSAAAPGLEAGLWHYTSRDHQLQQRARPLDPKAWDEHLAGGLILGLAGIHWREAWKYGLRAFRYCQHDAGHAIAAVSYAAATLGWQARVLPWGDEALAALLGLDRAADFHREEREVPELALWVAPPGSEPPDAQALLALPRAYAGRANQLSRSHRPWPGIDAVQEACRRPGGAGSDPEPAAPDLPALAEIPCAQAAADLIRQRRSAVDFDGVSRLPAAAWFAMLDALLPRPGVPPHEAWPRSPRVHLALFVHRVEGVAPGLYLLARTTGAAEALRGALREELLWEAVPGAPAHLPLWCLLRGDARDAARAIACHQDIAADSCFAVGMLAELDGALAEGPWGYRELFWECGLLGQVLYLEAEAAGVRGTGIGCFFDDAMHGLLGIRDTRWQSLYHFTAGGPVQDPRLQTHPPYAHLPRDRGTQAL